VRKDDPASEAERLELLWGGEFGNAYVDRNQGVAKDRGPFWRSLLEEFPAERLLEVGCNVGANLSWIAEFVPPAGVFGIDVNAKALAQLRATLPGVSVARCMARALPFRDCLFDLTFTMGVLIHQPPEVLPAVMSEVVRCSRRFIVCGEYYASEPTEVHYRGQSRVLFKRDFGELYLTLFPSLRILKKGFLTHGSGWIDVTYWVLERRI
jgi:pseudaminic acid biosynthesis-associated methylase